jgi:hypothetical protein
MRRLLFIVLAALVIAGFAALNWPEITRSTQLNFGILTMAAPLGLVLLTLLGLTLAIFLVSSTAAESRHTLEYRRQARELDAQRDLADKAEASRFTELRQYLDTHLRDYRQRESMASSEFEKSMLVSQRELRAQLEQLNHTLGSRLDELSGRLALRSDPVDVNKRVVDIPVRENM